MAKKTLIKLTAALLLLCIITMPIIAGSGLTDATVKSYEDRLSELAAQKQNALDELYTIRNNESSALAEIYKYDEIIKYNTEMKKLAEGQLDTITIQIETIKNDIKNAEGDIATQEAAFLERMRAAYMGEDIDYIELLLGAESLSDVLTKIDYINAVMRYDREIIEGLRNNKASLEENKQKLEEAEEKQLLRIKELEATIKDNQALSDAKYSYINKLQQDESKWNEVYSYVSAEEKKIDAELAAYLLELQKKNQMQYVGGALGWPLEMGVYYYVSSEFGWRTLRGQADNHYGIDLACANGTNIYAANAGTVLKVDLHWSYGVSVLIDHGGGIATLYAHMSERLVNPGDKVAAGQLIGYVGLTGNTTGYHLHFEVRKDGNVTNPRDYLVFP